MRIGILSMQAVNNIGSVLQSYSLKKFLSQMGHEVVFIDIQRNDEDDLLMREHTCSFASETQASTGIFDKLKKIDKYCFNRLRIKKLNSIQNDVFSKFAEVCLTKNVGKEEVDVCIIGSDEVFNCTQPSKWGFTSQLFGNVNEAKSVITYAASCGYTTYEMLPQTVVERIKESFLNVKALSVRDKNTMDFCKKMYGKDVIKHLDPALVGDFDDEIAGCNKNIQLPKRFCIVYSYYNRVNSKKEINEIKEFCKKHNLEIVTIGAPQMWIKNHLVLNPFEALYAFKKAEFVFTDTFHGTIFATKYSKKFGVVVRNSNANKLLDLVETLKIQKHMISEDIDLEKVYEVEKDESVYELLEKERLRTIMYLKENI